VMFRTIKMPYLAAGDGSGDSGGQSAEEILDDVAPDTEASDDDSQDDSDDSDDDEEVVPQDGDDTGDGEDEDKEDDEEGKDEDKEEKVDDKDADSSIASSPIKAATAKYPKLFKEFPELRESYFRDRDFRQIFPSVEDARLAYDATEQYTFIQNEVASGNPSSLVDFLARDTNALARFGRSFLRQSMTSNPEAFEHITKPILIGVLNNAMKEANLHGNKNLAASVKWISQFALGDPNVPADNFQADQAPQNGRNPVIEGQIKDFTDEVFEQGQNMTLELIADSIADLKINKAVKKTLIREMFAEADKRIASDKPHMKMMDSLWNKVRRGAVNRQNRATIVTAYVGAFKKLLPSVRASVLRDNGLLVKKGDKKAIRTTDKETRSQGSPAGKSPSARGKFAGKTDMEILDAFLK